MELEREREREAGGERWLLRPRKSKTDTQREWGGGN